VAEVTGIPAREHARALFLDVDGTLLEIAETPQAVHVPARLRHALTVAADREAGALALVSGRKISDLDALFQPQRFPAAGVHGLERRNAAGGFIEPAIDHHALDQARVHLTQMARSRPGLLIEDKRWALAAHFRKVPHLEDEIRAVMESLCRTLQPHFCLQTGKRVIELKPAVHSKRTAIASFMREPPFAGRLPVFIGDDDTDEDGFAAVNEQGGLSIRVGYAMPTVARWRLANVNEVIRWLAMPRQPHGRAISNLPL
jgi:trehalose 6-phosphate phosphatase